MEPYIYIDENKSGSLGISTQIISDIVTNCIKHVEGISLSEKQLGKNQYFRLNRPVQIKTANGIAHIKVVIDIQKDKSIQEITHKLMDEIESQLIVSIGRAPFDLQIKVESRI